MRFDRRFFLRTLGIGAGAYVLGPWATRPLRADAQHPARSFVFVYFNGGWDQLLALDPRDPTKFAGSNKIHVNYDMLPDGYPDRPVQPSGSKIAFGPAIGAFAKHFDKSCVIRGITMDTVTHQVGRRYMITGMQPRGNAAAGSSIPTRIVTQQGDVLAIPNLSSRVESFNEGLPPWAGALKVSSVNALLEALNDGGQAPDKAMREAIEKYRAEAINCDPAELDADGMMALVRGAQKKARGLVQGGYAERFNFLKKNAEGELAAIKARYKIASMVSGQAQAAMAFQALKYDIAQCVTIEIARGLDTHENWANLQPARLRAGFDALATLVDDLAKTPDKARGGMLLDHTTICAFSEFARTPRMNNRDGRDHWVASSALLLGAGVPHNKVIGGTSDDGMNAEAIDPNTGKPDGGGVALTPSRVMASLMKNAGFEIQKLRVDPLPCLDA